MSRSLVVVLASLVALTARAEELSPERAVQLAVGRNPTLQSAILAAQSSALEVQGEQARYAFVLSGTGEIARAENPGYSAQTGSPILATTGQDTIDGNIALSKHLYWGTDLTLTLDGGRATSRYRAYDPTTPLSTFGPAWDGGLRFQITQPLLRGFGNSVNEATLIQARARKTLAEVSRDQAASTLVYQVLVAYWESWYAQQATVIAKDALTLAEELLKSAQRRASIGNLAQVDVLPFETTAASRREDVATAQVQARTRSEALGQLIGLDQPGTDIPLSAVAPPDPDQPQGDLVQLALEASPSIRSAQASVESAKANTLGVGESSRAQLNLQAWAEARRAASSVSNLTNDAASGTGGGVGVTFQVPLDADLSRTAQARANIAVASSNQDLLAARRNVAAQTATQQAQESSARTSVTLSSQTAAIAQKQVDAQQIRLKTGTVIVNDVLTAEDSLRSAKLRNVRARVDLIEASLALDDLTGRLLQRYASSL